MLFEMCTTVCSLSELRSGLLAPATVEELLTRERDEELRPGLYSETGKKWLEEYKFELFKPFFPASEHRPGRSSLPELKSGLLAPAAVEELLTREYNEWPGRSSLSEFKSGLLAPAAVEELLIREYDNELQPGASNPDTGTRLSTGSHVALLVAQCLQREANWQVTFGCLNIIYMQDLIATITSTSLLGACITREFLENDGPTAELSSILGPDAPVRGFSHTSPVSSLGYTSLSQEECSWELLESIRHIAPVFHLADAEWSAEEAYEQYMALPSILTRNFLFKMYDTDAPRSRSLLSKEEGKKEYDGRPEDTR
ncbi:TPA: hypothetical protein ACH3X2_010011 [Trebouxia sp. C0005]